MNILCQRSKAVSRDKSYRAAALSLCLAAPLTSLAESGTVDFLSSGVTTVSNVPMGATTVTSRNGIGTVTVTKSSGGPFTQDASATQQCVSFSKKTASTFDLEAHCNIVFSPQDSLSFIFKRKVGDVVEGSSGSGVQQILNGTGRFAGVSGECTYKTQTLTANWVVTHSICKWSN